MVLRKLFPRTLIAFLALGIWSITASAQIQPRNSTQNDDVNDVSCLPDDFALIATTAITDSRPTSEVKPARPIIDIGPVIRSSSPNFIKFQPLLLAAIDERLGSPYSWGATGPRAYDCSGFVWSIFQSIGIDFERGSARTLFARFSPPEPDEQYKFGTLVFFSGLAHVGVVADEHGFYHASRHHGVIYSPFNEYWLKRIDGFRRVPLPAAHITD
jgi:cell wall-associated NlpC family hydrolase